jgi:hypothetical protein
MVYSNLLWQFERSYYEQVDVCDFAADVIILAQGLYILVFENCSLLDFRLFRQNLIQHYCILLIFKYL